MQVYNLRPPCAEVLAEYTTLGNNVPPVLLDNAVAPRTKEDAIVLTQNYLGEDRVGPANVHNIDPDNILARATATCTVDPVDHSPDEPRLTSNENGELSRLM